MAIGAWTIPNITAQGPDVTGRQIAPTVVSDFSQIQLTIINIIRWFYTLFFIAAVFFFLLAAYNYIRGGTNEEYIKTAKSQLKYGAIGIVIALVASGISLVLQNFIWSRGSF